MAGLKALVTGGLGVIGGCIAASLLTDGYDVAVIDADEKPRNHFTARALKAIPRNGGRLAILHTRIERMPMDDLVDELSRANFVLHAAASTGIPHSEKDPDDDWRSNVDATKRLLDAARTLGPTCPPIVALSSVKPYGLEALRAVEKETRWVLEAGTLGVNEDFPLIPDEPYAASKAAQSMLCMAYARSYDLPVTVLRCSNLYGPGACHGPRHGWLTWFCIAGALGKTIEIQGSGKQTRDMLFASDVGAAALLAALKMIEERQTQTPAAARTVAGHVFNIGGGAANAISVMEAVRLISDGLDGAISTHRGPGRKREDMLFIVNHSRFTAATGWVPEIGVGAGVSEILKWATASASDLHPIYRDP
jgi:CDP-paratose 2-epimerase